MTPPQVSKPAGAWISKIIYKLPNERMMDEMSENLKGDPLVFLDSIMKMIGALIINVITALVFVGVILRYIFHMYSPVTGEIPQELMVILALLLMGILWKQKQHITIDFVYERFRPKFRFVVDFIINLGALFAGCFWLWGSIMLFITDLRDGSESLQLKVPWGYYHFFEILAFAIFVIYMLAELRKLILQQRKRR